MSDTNPASKPKIAIVNSSSFGRIFTEHLDQVNALGDVTRVNVDALAPTADLLPHLTDVDAIIAGVNPQFAGDLLEQLPKLKIIARHGIGYNNVDFMKALELGIAVTNVEGIIEQNAVAEHAVALLLSATRKIPQGNQAVRESRWADRAKFTGPELSGCNVGVIGIGNIGSRFAEIMATGFGCPILACDPSPAAPYDHIPGLKRVDLQTVLRESDVISIHADLNPTSRHMLGEKEFAMVKPSLILVNTARGDIVQDRVLLEFLNQGKIAAYATDVVEGEPVDNSWPLLQSDRVIAVPHLGGYGDRSMRGMGETCVEAVKSVLQENKIPSQMLVPELQAITEVRT